MRIRSSQTGKLWLEPVSKKKDEHGEVQRDLASEQIRRALSELLHCQNLVVVSGLGTSMCVTDNENPPKRKAPTMGDLWEKVREFENALGEDELAKLVKLVKHPEDNKNIEELLSQCKVAESFFAGEELKTIQRFIKNTEATIRRAVSFLSEDDHLAVHSTFLRRIARRPLAKSRIKIFTTNYDLCFEQAAKDGRFVVIDGFSPTLPPTFDPVYFTYDIVRREGETSGAGVLIPNVFQLYKLHGSIDWERAKNGIEKKVGTENPLLIYPRSSKYEQAFSQPYLEMMSAFQAALRAPNTGLLVIGFGFNDNHISEPILSAIRSNLGLKVVVVDPAFVSILDGHHHVGDGGGKDDLNEQGEYEEPGTADSNQYLQQIMNLMDQGDARLAFLLGTFEELTAEMPDLVAESEQEKHMERVRSTGEIG